MDVDLFTKHEKADRLVIISPNPRSDGVYGRFTYVMEISDDDPAFPVAPPRSRQFFSRWGRAAMHIAFLLKKGLRVYLELGGVEDMSQSRFRRYVAFHLEHNFS
jgi:hypothetical protein